MSTHANGPAGNGAGREIQMGAGVSTRIMPDATDNGTEDALFGPDLSVPATPADAVDGAVQAGENASAWDRDRLRRFIEHLAASGVEFTADHVRDAGIEADHSARIGAAFMAASKRDVIVCVGVTTSKTGSRHGGLQRVWVGTGVAS